MTENRSARPPATGGGAGSRLNWAAVSAVATAAAVVVAVVAYLAPPAPPPPVHPDTVTPVERSPSPDPVTPRPEPPTPTPSPESGTPEQPEPEPEPEPSRTRRARESSPPLAAVQSPGCDETMTALAGYRRNAGSTRSSQAAAAQQTYRDLMGAGLGAQGMVGSMISRLAAEFQELSFRLTGMTGGDPNQVIADINADFAELKRLCGAT